MCHDSFIYGRYDSQISYIWAPWLTHQMTSHICRLYARFIYVPWLICIHTYICAVPHLYMCHDSMCHDSFVYIHTYVPCPICICAMTRLYMGSITHKSAALFIYVPWLIDMCTYVPWLIHICAMTRLYMGSMTHKSAVRRREMKSLYIYICAMTHLYMCHDSFIYVPWLVDSQIRCKKTGDEVAIYIYICAMAHLYMCHDSFTYVPWLIYICAMTRWLTNQL